MRYTLFFAGIFLVTAVLAGEYHVDKSQDNVVRFISDAPIEDFEGVTSKIDGYLYWEEDDLLNNSQLYFEVDLNSLDTGIGLRNRHMRENYLETDKYPLTHYKGKLVKAEQTSPGVYNVTAQGTMYIHGVEQNKSVEGVLKKHGERYEITTGFNVKLSDYNIDIPSVMFYKIDETMALEVHFFVKKHE